VPNTSLSGVDLVGYCCGSINHLLHLVLFRKACARARSYYSMHSCVFSDAEKMACNFSSKDIGIRVGSIHI
jgi:hypothetical protein